MNKQQLAQKIWASANQMRSKIEANEYKDYILGFIFYKYLSDKEVSFLIQNDYDEETLKTVDESDTETVEWVQSNIGYFISYKNLFSTWLSMGKAFDVSNVRDALSAFNRLISKTHKNVFEKIFDTLQTGLSKLGDSSGSQTKMIVGLINLIKDIPMDGKQDYDVLGFIYEYLISNFAANAGKKAGEFYTPHEVSLLMSEIVASHLKGRNEIKIYDPTSGSGSLLINIGKSVAKYMNNPSGIKYYAQELKENTYNLTRMNLVMRGISPDNIVTRNGDTLEDDWPYFDEEDPINTYNPLYVDAVISNPPYSQAWDPSNKEGDPRYSRYGLAPKGKADYAFLLHDLYHIKSDGIMTIVLPHGVLFRGGEEGTIRKNLIENNNIDAIIGLPANIFFGTGIPTIIMVLKQRKEDTDVLIIDASKGFIKEGKNNKLRSCDIKKISDTYTKRESIPKYSKVVSREEIRSNDYNLNIPRYVDSSEENEAWDLYASMFGGIPESEIDELSSYWDAFPNLRNTLFSKDDIPYVKIAVSDIKKAINEHQDIVSFKNDFSNKFSSFSDFLKSELIDNMEGLDISKEESIISEKIFSNLENIRLINKYEAYQLLDDNWGKISIDLEIIQTEGFDSVRKVDPNLITKKKDGQDTEVQDGWVGHVIPFDLIQRTILKSETEELEREQEKLNEYASEKESILNDLSEDDKQSLTDVLNQEGDDFVPKEVSKKIKELKKDKSSDSEAMLSTLARVDELAKFDKDTKARIKSLGIELEKKSKEIIGNLSKEEALSLLQEKWITPLVDSLDKLPNSIIDTLLKRIEALSSKYETTFFDVEKQVKETEQSLSNMIDDLVGNEFDMAGLRELKQLLGGSDDEKH